jgi:integrase
VACAEANAEQTGAIGDAPMSVEIETKKCRPNPDRHLKGQKRPLKPKEVWAIRIRLEMAAESRNLALFNLAIDSKLRACDLVAIKVEDICMSGRVRDRAIIVQRKTGRPVQFEITETTRRSVQNWIDARKLHSGYLFPSRHRESLHLSRRQYARIVDDWVKQIGLPAAYGTHSTRRTKAAQIYRKTGNLRAVQLLLRTATYCPRTAN